MCKSAAAAETKLLDRLWTAYMYSPLRMNEQGSWADCGGLRWRARLTRMPFRHENENKLSDGCNSLSSWRQQQLLLRGVQTLLRFNMCVCGCSLGGVYIVYTATVDSTRSVRLFNLGGLIKLVAPLRCPHLLLSSFLVHSSEAIERNVAVYL